MARKLYTPEEVQKRLESLPTDIQNLVYSADMDGVIQKIGLKHQLHIDQMALLEAEVGEVMLGFTESKDFLQNLIDTLQIDRTKAETLVKDINEGLFVKIRESMKKLLPQVPTTPTPAPTPPVVPKPSVPPIPKPPQMHPADMMLSQKTVTSAPVVPKPVVSPPVVMPKPATAPVVAAPAAPKVAPPAPPAPPKPQPYKADPYREPTT